MKVHLPAYVTVDLRLYLTASDGNVECVISLENLSDFNDAKLDIGLAAAITTLNSIANTSDARGMTIEERKNYIRRQREKQDDSITTDRNDGEDC